MKQKVVNSTATRREKKSASFAVRWCLVLSAVLLFLEGCASVPMPELGQIYSDAARHHGPGRNPVIVIPGILGSRLLDGDSGKLVWGAFGSDSVSPNSLSGARLLAHPMGAGPLDHLRDGITAPSALDRARFQLIGLPVDLAAYASLLGTLGAGGYLDNSFRAVDYGTDHYTCFQFPYDWRRDNIENARRLHFFILDKKKEVEAEHLRRFGRSGVPVKFDIVAHSMGGLITRYMLMYGGQEPASDGSPPPLTWEGSRHVEKVILVGTPNDGSLAALQQLVQGFRPAPILPLYDPALLGTMPSIYQLLPDPRLQPVVDMTTGRTLDYLDPETWERQGWGLASPDADEVLRKILLSEPDAARRKDIALAHLRKSLARARAFRAALARPHTLPSGLQMQLYAGDAAGTVSAMTLGKNGELTASAFAPGDGTVLRSSALYDLRTPRQQNQTVQTPIPWSKVMFLHRDHLGLTQDPTFADNVLYTLLLSPNP